jgi:hypothetical protein
VHWLVESSRNKKQQAKKEVNKNFLLSDGSKQVVDRSGEGVKADKH